MNLLSLQVALRPTGKKPAVNAGPYLGGVMHGVFEHLVRTHAPKLIDALGMSGTSQPTRYAVLPPPYGWQAKPEQALLHLGCGIMLFGGAAEHAQTVSEALRHWRELRFGGEVDRVEQIRIDVHHPPAPQEFSPLESLTLDWVTPVLLDSQGQRAAGAANASPSLYRVVRSLAARIRHLEPELAILLGLGDRASRDEIFLKHWEPIKEKIRHTPIERHSLNPISWRYGSRTKERTFDFTGLIGEITYAGPIAAPIHALLQWGSWFGVGQRTALGQGLYHIKENDA